MSFLQCRVFLVLIELLQAQDHAAVGKGSEIQSGPRFVTKGYFIVQ